MSARLVQCYSDVGPHKIHSWCSKDCDDDRPAVILLHGFVVSSAYMLPLARRLAKKYRLFIPDLPGHGKSSNPENALSVAEFAEVLYQWMRAMNLDQASIVANSFGCQIAAKLAYEHPELVSKLVLIGIPNHNEKSFIKQFTTLLVDVAYEQSSLVPIVFQDFWKTSPLDVLEAYRSMQSDNITKGLRKLEAPTLVIRGENDFFVPESWLKEIDNIIPNSEVAIVPDAGHAAQFTKPDETARLVDAFLDGEQRVDEAA